MAAYVNESSGRGAWAGIQGGIDPATRLGYVHLTVSDLEKQLAFYQGVLGFKLHWREGARVGLGAGGEDLLRLTGQPGARRPFRTTGLYHFCLRVPERVELAQLLCSIAAAGAPLHGLVDHRTAEAIYLPDPEGNGIELDWDHPREQWPGPVEALRLGNAPLDEEGLLGELAAAPGAWSGLHSETTVGHMHLHVADLVTARAFYHGVLGFDVMQSIPGQAEFVSAGGYHHHIAYNVWAGVGAPPPPADAAGLRYFTVRLPHQAALEQVLERARGAGLPLEDTGEGLLARDPSRNSVLLTIPAES
ncbi:MAG: VOC family protein [Chloroflexota bacterium]